MGCKRIFGATLSMGIAAERTYHGNDLGAVYSAESTTFRVWAPSAELVILRRYSTGSDTEDGASVLEELDMEKDIERNSEWNGVWKVTVSGDIADTYYTYLVNVDGKINETNDIYAKAAGVNGQRGMVVNLASTNPEGWDQDRHVLADKQTDAMVWEVHVRDFSSSPDSGMENKGKYLAFTEKNTTVNGEGGLSTGVSYLKELGVNYVQLLPVFDYVNDETDESNLSYDWGYSPLNYQVPEGLYATDPYDGNVRIREFKQMVQSLHEEQIGVVMNHKELKQMLIQLKEQGLREVVEANDMDKLMRLDCREDYGTICRTCSASGSECPKKKEKREQIRKGCIRLYEICEELSLSCSRAAWDTDEEGMWQEQYKGIDDWELQEPEDSYGNMAA